MKIMFVVFLRQGPFRKSSFFDRFGRFVPSFDSDYFTLRSVFDRPLSIVIEAPFRDRRISRTQRPAHLAIFRRPFRLIFCRLLRSFRCKKRFEAFSAILHSVAHTGYSHLRLGSSRRLLPFFRRVQKRAP